MKRMKTFFIYFLIFIGFYILSNILIDAYIKTSYYKISSYEIDVDAVSVTILTAKASKEDGYIEGKIYNNTEEDVIDRYMKVELLSDSGVTLGCEYIKIDLLYSKDLKDFKVNFKYDNVRSFKITFLTPEEKAKEDEERNKPLIDFIPESSGRADKIIDELEEEMYH